MDECVMGKIYFWSRKNERKKRNGCLFLWFNVHDWVICTFVWSGEISSATSSPARVTGYQLPGGRRGCKVPPAPQPAEGGRHRVQSRGRRYVFHLTPVRQCREYFRLMPRNSARFILLNSFVSGPSGVVVSPPARHWSAGKLNVKHPGYI